MTASMAAKADLKAMVRQGLLEFGHQCFEYDTRIFEKYTSYGGEYLFELLPRTMLSDRETRRSEGIFKGLRAAEIFDICFTKDALEFLLGHAYSPWYFWSNVRKLSSIYVSNSAEEVIPFTLAFVQSRILVENTPFGMAGSQFSDTHSTHLKALIQGMGGSLDISKLEPKMAFFLMQYGLIFQKTKPERFSDIAELVVNPLWRDWLTSFTTPSAEVAITTEPAAAPEQAASPNNNANGEEGIRD